ncbi:DUF6134 family protein [Denitrobaculum tricleocarpae]|uniref:DUF3108 domain-containing protein n=1 Tax=Denitrobaculum tricleocarpae TaxID=2591009 RepID=A0A545U194_9PROT|nr:DUF6134 family protein [Denitrobaculum tricleocarpae]TQV83257.1 hypothetical protein FKG95_01255 [Denitrobaculum tricleocarpae]
MAAVFLLVPNPGLAAECVRFPADGERQFDISRNGSLVGSQSFRFSRRDGQLLVRSAIDIEVTRGSTLLYRYRHDAEESWLAGRLQAFVSDTDDNGTRYLVRAERIEGIFRGRVNGQSFTVSGFVVPASFWHRDTPSSQVLWDGVDGEVKVVRGEDQGPERIEVLGETVEARRYELGGQIQRVLWYDRRCALVRMSYLAQDGAKFVVQLR